MQELKELEKNVCLLYKDPAERWRISGLDAGELSALNEKITTMVEAAYSNLTINKNSTTQF